MEWNGIDRSLSPVGDGVLTGLLVKVLDGATSPTVDSVTLCCLELEEDHVGVLWVKTMFVGVT